MVQIHKERHKLMLIGNSLLLNRKSAVYSLKNNQKIVKIKSTDAMKPVIIICEQKQIGKWDQHPEYFVALNLN